MSERSLTNREGVAVDGNAALSRGLLAFAFALRFAVLCLALPHPYLPVGRHT